MGVGPWVHIGRRSGLYNPRRVDDFHYGLTPSWAHEFWDSPATVYNFGWHMRRVFQLSNRPDKTPQDAHITHTETISESRFGAGMRTDNAQTDDLTVGDSKLWSSYSGNELTVGAALSFDGAPSVGRISMIKAGGSGSGFSLTYALSDNLWRYDVANSSTFDTAAATTAEAESNDVLIAVAGRSVGTAMSIWRNGVEEGTGTKQIGSGTADTIIGGRAGSINMPYGSSSVCAALNGWTYSLFVSEAALSDAFLEAWGREPFAIFAQSREPVTYLLPAVVAAGGATIPIFHRHYEGMRRA